MSQVIINQIQKNTQTCLNLSREINEMKNFKSGGKITNQQDLIKKIKYFDEEINKINFNLEEMNNKIDYIMHYIDTNKLSSQPDFESI